MLKRSSRRTSESFKLPALPPVIFAEIDFLAIFPPIGVARLGNSMKDYFLGPELPKDNDSRGNILPTEDNKFRDNVGDIRRQAARFRVYAYNKEKKILGEVNNDNGYTLTWTVDVVNKKAAGDRINSSNDGKRNPDVVSASDRAELIVNSKGNKITRINGEEVVQLMGKFKSKLQPSTDVNLGQLQVDDAGRLVFIGAKGDIIGKMPPNSGSLNNDDCVDDTCDGSIDVTIKSNSGLGTKQALYKAAVLSGPPKFAWDLHTTTSIFDLTENVYHPTSIKPEFNVDIWPVLEAASWMSWVNDTANKGHGPVSDNNFIALKDKLRGTKTEDQEYKVTVFDSLNEPGGRDTSKMPKLNHGPTSSSALTKLQHERFKQWKEHNFSVETLKVVAQLEELKPEEQTKCLTRANLEMTIGASFYPGIEACDIVTKSATYDTTIKVTDLDPPYRVKFSIVHPGDLTAALSLPWQADFEQCGASWWPAARPVSVLTTINDPKRYEWAQGAEGTEGKEMLTKWHQLGFVRRPFIANETRIESERTLQRGRA